MKVANLYLVFLLVLSVFGSSELLGEALPGYPHDPFSKDVSQYDCLEATQHPKSAGGILYHLCIDKDLTPLGKNIARQAFESFVMRILSPELYACLAQEPSLEAQIALSSHESFLRKWVTPALSARPLSPVAAGEVSTYASGLVYISAMVDDDKLFAEGYLNYFDNRGFASEEKIWRRHISIGVNRELIGSHEFPLGGNIDFWASMMGMTYFKNMGVREDLLALSTSPLHSIGQCLLTRPRP